MTRLVDARRYTCLQSIHPTSDDCLRHGDGLATNGRLAREGRVGIILLTEIAARDWWGSRIRAGLPWCSTRATMAYTGGIDVVFYARRRLSKVPGHTLVEGLQAGDGGASVGQYLFL